MIIKNNKVNPLNVLGLRKVDFPAYHFVYTEITKYSSLSVSKVDTWIKDNLRGRYYLGESIGISHDGSVIYITKVGFENEKELSFFNLACPHLT